MTSCQRIIAIISLVICSSVFGVWGGNCSGSAGDEDSWVSHERRLVKCLFQDYDSSVRPVANYSQSVTVSLDMNLMQVVGLNEQMQTLDLNVWITKSWTDFQLKWDPKKFGNVKDMRVPRDRIWLPDIILLNNAALDVEYVMDKLAHVRYDGVVTWVPHARVRSFCAVRLHLFPFDKQTCHVMFGSWTYELKQLNITTLAANSTLKYYQVQGEWNIVHYSLHRKEYTYTKPDLSDPTKLMVKEVYPYLVYELTMQRASQFYGAVLVSPIVMLVILTNFIFFVPPHASERLTLSIGIIISLSILTLVIDDHIPSNVDELPLIFKYMLFDFVMTTIAILISILVYNFHHREYRKGKVPTVIRRVILGFFRKVLCMKAEPYNSLPSDVPFVDSGDGRYDLPAAQEMDTATTPLPKSPTMALEKILDDIRKYLKQLSTRQPTNEVPSHRQLVVSEWHQVALVLDRVAFFTYVILTLLVSLSVLRH